jgi:uncharacterized protein
VPTPVGDARVHLAPAAGEPRAVFAVSHGASGGIDARDLRALRRALPEHGVEVAAVEQPWRVAGRKVAAAPAQLDIAWLAVTAALGARRRGTPLVVGGRSAGARVACRQAVETGAVGVVALAFPLHPPGRPERSRLAELTGAGVPTLVVQGERDPFGRPEEFPDDLGPDVRLCPVPAADHSFTVLKSGPVTQEETLATVVDVVVSWLTALLRESSPASRC